MRLIITIHFACQLLFVSCKKQDCQTCTQTLAEDYYPARKGFPKTTSSGFYSCGPNNSWIGEQIKIQRFVFKDTLVTKILTVDCKWDWFLLCVWFFYPAAIGVLFLTTQLRNMTSTWAEVDHLELKKIQQKQSTHRNRFMIKFKKNKPIWKQKKKAESMCTTV